MFKDCKKNNNNLMPVIIQEKISGEVLMLGYMNDEALKMTKKTGLVYFWSRKRNKLWMKGEESGNKLRVINIFIDCDADALLIKAKLTGDNVCHTGRKNCFFRKLL